MTPPARPLGTCGLEITTVGFGSWAVGGGGWAFGWGPQDDERSVDAIAHAVELGVNWVDTPASTALGHSEEVVGRAVRALPADARPLVFTKCGLEWDRRSRWRRRGAMVDAATVRRGAEDSLRRLGLDHIDLFQIHWPDDQRQPHRAGLGGDAQARGRGPGARRRRVQLRRAPARALRGARPRGLPAAAVLAHQPRDRRRTAAWARSTAPASSATAR